MSAKAGVFSEGSTGEGATSKLTWLLARVSTLPAVGLRKAGLVLNLLLKLDSLIHFPPPFFFQTVASPRVSGPLLLCLHLPWSLLWNQRMQNP